MQDSHGVDRRLLQVNATKTHLNKLEIIQQSLSQLCRDNVVAAPQEVVNRINVISQMLANVRGRGLSYHNFINQLTAINIPIGIYTRLIERGDKAQADAQLNKVESLITEAIRSFNVLFNTAEEIILSHHQPSTDVGQNIRDVTHRILTEATAAEIVINVFGDVDFPPQVHADLTPNQIEEIIYELTHNARKYSYPGTEISILITRAYREAGQPVVRVAVHNLGLGILPEDMPYITTPAYRGSNVGDIPGTGLGLSQIHHLITNVGGKLNIMSNPDDLTMVEADFPVTLPEG